MAHVDDSGSTGRQISVDVNIVPFIDLMSVLIIFLLFTAVWTQVSMIQIGSSVYGKKQAEQDPIEPPKMAEIPFRMDVRADGYRIVVGRQVTTVPLLSGVYDISRLKTELKNVKELYPEKNDVVVTMEDELAYLRLIEGMDALLGAGFPEISIATGGAQ